MVCLGANVFTAGACRSFDLQGLLVDVFLVKVIERGAISSVGPLILVRSRVLLCI